MSPFKVQNCPLNRDTAVFGAIVADAFLEMGLDKQLVAETTDRNNITSKTWFYNLPAARATSF